MYELASPILAVRALARVEASTPNLFSPDSPLVWWLGTLRYATDKQAPLPTKVTEAGRKVWYGKLHQPRVSSEGNRVFPDFRGHYGGRSQARGYCRTPMDFVAGFPYEQPPLDDELFTNPTFCRPLYDEKSQRKDAEHALLYTTTLEDFICPALAARIKELETENAQLLSLAPQARRVIKLCEPL